MAIKDMSGFIMQEVFVLHFEDTVTGQLLGKCEQLQDMTIANTQDTVYALGKDGVKLAGFDRNKAMNLTATSGQFSDFLLALQTGSNLEVLTDALIPQEQELVVMANKATTKYVAQGAIGQEIKFAYIGGDYTTPLTQGATATATTFTYTPLTGAITFLGLTDGTVVNVKYEAKAANAKRISNETNKFSKTVKITGYASVLDACSKEEYLAAIIIPSGKISGNFDFSLGGDPAVQNLEVEALGNCKSKRLWDLLLLDENDLVTI